MNVPSRKLAALGRLALGLAHEIRNPLFSIRMNMQMIRRKIHPTGSVDESFAIVEEEVQRLNRLLNHVMGFARPVPLRLEPTDAGDLLRKVLLLLKGRLDDDGVEVRADVDGALQPLSATRNRSGRYFSRPTLDKIQDYAIPVPSRRHGDRGPQ